MMKKIICLIGCLGISAMTSPLSMAGLLVADEELRSDLSWLSTRGIIHLSLSTWPLSEEEVRRTLQHAREQDPAGRIVLNRVHQRLDTLKNGGRFGAFTSTDNPGAPQGFAATRPANHSLSLALNHTGDEWDIHLQGQVEGDMQTGNGSRMNADGTYSAVKFMNQWLSFGFIPQWWGPGNEGSLIRSDAARPLAGVMLQRAEQTPPETGWLRWVGPWQYQLSAGQIRQYASVPEAKLIGGRLTFSPFSPLEVGLSRVMQWGGEGRPDSVGSFMDGVLGKDNTGTPDEPGNQLAGVDFRLHLASLLGWPVSVYGQMVGEDEAGYLPSANMFMGGIEGHHVLGDSVLNWNLEGLDTRRDFQRTGYSYTHHIYRDGYYQQGYPLGSALGGDGRMLAGSVERVMPDNQRWRGRLLYARVNPDGQGINKAFPRSDTLWGAQLGWRGEVFQSVRLSTSLWHTRSVHAGNTQTGVNAGLEITF